MYPNMVFVHKHCEPSDSITVSPQMGFDPEELCMGRAQPLSKFLTSRRHLSFVAILSFEKDH